MTDVWIDTDPSIGVPFHEADDGFALIEAFHSPELCIRGISTTYGNASLEITTRIARDMAGRFGGSAGVTAAHVFAGAASARDLGRPNAATEALGRALGERPLTYLALAPLTNLATFLTLHPAAARRIERVIFVGGRTPGVRFRAGRWNPYEFTDGNFYKDNAAAAILLAVGPPLTLVPVELALHWPLLPDELARIGREGGPAGRYLAKRARLWMLLWRLCFGVRGGIVFDCLAVLAASHPHLLERECRHAAIIRNPGASSADNPRDIQLVASREPLSVPTREVIFCPRAAADLRPVLVARLLGARAN
jgi:inosine-uridine nucleoside N-ribohydrolase